MLQLRDLLRNGYQLPKALLWKQVAADLGLGWRPFTWKGYTISDKFTLTNFYELDRPQFWAGWADRMPQAPMILDIGAGVGVFGWLCHLRWSEAPIIGFEPDRERADQCWRLGCYTKIFQAPLSCGPNCSGQRLDNLELKPDMIKLDVDGDELKIIAGGINTFLATPEVIVECHTARRTATVADLLQRKPHRLTCRDIIFTKGAVQ